MADIRQRKTTAEATPAKTTTDKNSKSEPSSSISFLDVCRLLLVFVTVFGAASYYVTSGESFLFGYPRPWFTKPAELARHFKGPISLTLVELEKYDGTDPSLPIYLSINGTIFDVSAGAHTYGPGGSYHPFAGHDGSRAFVTGCFMEDRTMDLRGAEEVYLPVEDPDEKITSGERKTRAERERRLAKAKVRDEVNKWHTFYSTSSKYFPVGKVVGLENMLDTPIPTLCAQAQKGRPKRSAMNAASAAPGKPVL